ncbi:unnamed protein product [Fusarium equiseti]|uniref:Adenylate kinase n=1 Tax=Fusarium equiseti TaxID=61235 RepID=A0A8J2ITG4_FUSEQ|nr:unnamed protein product [Fusarium equiseti]
MHLQSDPSGQSRKFAIIFVLGAPGAGKGTLSTHLAQKHNLLHYSVGDGLRAWMRENRSTEPAAKIQSKLDNQRFLTSEDLKPFIYQQMLDAINCDGPEMDGILIDGYLRCMEQLNSFGSWPFQDTAPLAPGSEGEVSLDIKPDLVLSLQVLKQKARERYMSRARDNNDSADKFEKRFTEYELETVPVEDEYRRRGVLVPIDVNGTKEENIEVLSKTLQESEI